MSRDHPPAERQSPALAGGLGPLVAFTSLAIAGAGLAAASACFALLYRHSWPPAAPAGALLLAAGLVLSFGHVAQKRRAGLAALGAGRSRLSNEVFAAALALAGASAAAAAGLAGHSSTALTAVSGALNALFLLSIGYVYHLRGQRTWRGSSFLTPLSGGLAFGAIVIQALSVRGGVFVGTLVLIAIDLLVFSQRWRELAGLQVPAPQVAGSWWPRRDQVLGARFFLVDVLPFFLLLTRLPGLAAACAAAGLIVDRAGFYALAVQHTTEHEVAAVEDMLSKGSDS